MIAAAVTDTNSAVTNVEFLVNGAVLTNSTTAPFAVTASNLTNGLYTLTVIATDTNGFSGSNSVPITVAAAPLVTITSPRRGDVHHARDDYHHGKRRGFQRAGYKRGVPSR